MNCSGWSRAAAIILPSSSGCCLTRAGGAGLPVLVGGGFGVEKPPETQRKQWVFGRLYYYPYVLNEVPYKNMGYQYSILRYEAAYGHSLGHIGKARLLGTIGIAGDHATAVVNAPTNVDITSLEIGLGVGF